MNAATVLDLLSDIADSRNFYRDELRAKQADIEGLLTQLRDRNEQIRTLKGQRDSVDQAAKELEEERGRRSFAERRNKELVAAVQRMLARRPGSAAFARDLLKAMGVGHG